MDNDKGIYKSIIEKFNKAKVAVVGDIAADVYVYGRQFKLSREAPVVVARYENEEVLPGCAGNITNNIHSLGATVYPMGLIGNDYNGKSLLSYFSSRNIDTKGILICDDRITITKTRFMVGDSHTTKRQVVRFDREPDTVLGNKTEQKILDCIDAVKDMVDLFIVSDYGYDIMTMSIIEHINMLAKDKMVVVDSRHRIKEFKGVTIITPNESEAAEAANIKINNKSNLFEAGKKLLREVSAKAVLITRGNQGMTLFEDNGKTEEIPVHGKNEVIDVTGAGDTVASIISLGIISGASFLQAAKLSNYGASVKVMKNGPAAISKSELIRAIDNNP